MLRHRILHCTCAGSLSLDPIRHLFERTLRATYGDEVRVDDVDQAADHDDEITAIRRITEVVLRERERAETSEDSGCVAVRTRQWNAAIFRIDSQAKMAVKTMFR